jgi:hypothetical protein
MARRVGIELSPATCRIVEISTIRRGEAPETRVSSYAILPAGGSEMASRLLALRRQPVAVVAWGLNGDHRQVVVRQGSYERMMAEALRATGDAGLATRDMTADIAPISPAVRRTARRTVLLTTAPRRELSSALRPLREARLRIQTVVTPAGALLSLFRLRRTFAVPDATEAYVALDERATAVALVRNGRLIAARELPWGFGGASVGPSEQWTREEVARRLGDDFIGFLSAARIDKGSIRQISICGGIPELRSMTLPLMEQLDVEVEALDSMFGIDSEHLPPPSDAFREAGAELRLAWAIAADTSPPVNLMRYAHRRQARTRLARGAVAAGMVAGLGVGWRMEQSGWWRARQAPGASPPLVRGTPSVPALQPAPPPQTRSGPDSAEPLAASPAAARVGAAGPEVPRPSPPAPGVTPPAAGTSPTPRSPDSRAAAAAPPTVPRPAAPPPDPASGLPRPVTPSDGSPKAAAPPPPPVPRVPPQPATPVAAPPSPSPRAAPPPPARTAPAVPERNAIAPQAPVRVSPPVAVPARPRVEPQPTPPPVPFDASLQTILYSPDRKLAIIDGRIVTIGDDVRGARIVDITETGVLLRDAEGRLRGLSLRSTAR